MMFWIISTKKLKAIRADADERVEAAQKTADMAVSAYQRAEKQIEALKSKPSVFCSFCAKGQHDVKMLIAGPSSLFICDECTELCMQIVIEKNIQARAAE